MREFQMLHMCSFYPVPGEPSTDSTRCLELGLDKEETKKTLNDAIEKAAAFFGLGNKKAVKGKGKKK